MIFLFVDANIQTNFDNANFFQTFFKLFFNSNQVNLSMPYVISDYSFKKAKELGVTIKPSTNPEKKIDVFKNGRKIASIGAKGYLDYPTYLKLEQRGKVPKGYADKRKRLYKVRHANDIGISNKNGYFANKILW
jgi:hypothetical protein